MHGQPAGELWIADYDTSWPQIFDEERDLILRAFPADACVEIQHLGSTSVPGLCAKPIIDIAIALDRHEAGDALIAPLEVLNYVHRGEFGLSERRYFVKGKPRTFQIHMFPRTSQKLNEMLTFRDALRASLELRDAYARLKRELQASVGGDKTRYQEEKTEFITEAVRRGDLSFT